MSRTIDKWLFNQLQPYLPDKFDSRQKMQDNAEEVGLILEKRGLELDSIFPANRQEGRVVRRYILRDKRHNEIISTIVINLKTGNEVV